MKKVIIINGIKWDTSSSHYSEDLLFDSMNFSVDLEALPGKDLYKELEDHLHTVLSSVIVNVKNFGFTDFYEKPENEKIIMITQGAQDFIFETLDDFIKEMESVRISYIKDEKNNLNTPYWNKTVISTFVAAYSFFKTVLMGNDIYSVLHEIDTEKRLVNTVGKNKGLKNLYHISDDTTRINKDSLLKNFKEEKNGNYFENKKDSIALSFQNDMFFLLAEKKREEIPLVDAVVLNDTLFPMLNSYPENEGMPHGSLSELIFYLEEQSKLDRNNVIKNIILIEVIELKKLQYHLGDIIGVVASCKNVPAHYLLKSIHHFFTVLQVNDCKHYVDIAKKEISFEETIHALVDVCSSVNNKFGIFIHQGHEYEHALVFSIKDFQKELFNGLVLALMEEINQSASNVPLDSLEREILGVVFAINQAHTKHEEMLLYI